MDQDICIKPRAETAAPHAIFAQTPGLAPMLERQLEKAVVENRENPVAHFLLDAAAQMH